jgi:hypothetical protein
MRPVSTESPEPITAADCAVFELRQYTLHPGGRDVLIELFDREFVETQEAVDMAVIGQFRDLDDPERFVWIRGFRDLGTRKRGLETFYGGPVWKQHREAANATMIESDDVLLLRPARPGAGFEAVQGERPPPGSTALDGGLVVATICHLGRPAEQGFLDQFETSLAPLLRDAGVPVVACLVTEHSPNDVPALPIREGENVLVWFARFADEASFEPWRSAPAHADLLRDPQVLRLSPTSRSWLRAETQARG